MNKIDKVYVVTAGEYSDYHIETICINREDAERYLCLHQGADLEEMRIEEYPICNGKELVHVKINRGVNFYMRDTVGITSRKIIYSSRPVEQMSNPIAMSMKRYITGLFHYQIGFLLTIMKLLRNLYMMP